MSRTFASVNEVWRELRNARNRAHQENHYAHYSHHGYDPNQPRVPKGHPDGGQWTDTWRDEVLQESTSNEPIQSHPSSNEILSDALPDQPRVWSQYAQAGIGHNDQDPAIERNKEILHSILMEVNRKVATATRGNPVSAKLYGVLVHAEFARVSLTRPPGHRAEGSRAKF
jgi:hypothetical protein